MKCRNFPPHNTSGVAVVHVTIGLGGSCPGGICSGDCSLVSSEISDFTPCARAQSNILYIKYAEKSDDWGLGIRV